MAEPWQYRKPVEDPRFAKNGLSKYSQADPTWSPTEGMTFDQLRNDISTSGGYGATGWNSQGWGELQPGDKGYDAIKSANYQAMRQYGGDQGWFKPHKASWSSLKGAAKNIAPVALAALGGYGLSTLGAAGATGAGAGGAATGGAAASGLGGASGTVGSIFGAPAITGGGLAGTAGGLGGAAVGGVGTLGAGSAAVSGLDDYLMMHTLAGGGSPMSTLAPGVSASNIGTVGANLSGIGAAGGAAGSAGLLSNSIPSYTPAQNAAGVVQGGNAAIGGGAGAASSPGLLGGITKAGVGKAIKDYGPLIFAGVEYANSQEAAKAYEDQLNRQIEMSDPFGPERARYQQMLAEHMSNPEAFLSSPQVQFAADAAARKQASMGYNLSPRQSQAIADASIGKYYEQANLLAGLAGSGISPNMGALNAATQNLVNSRTASTAAGGDLARQAYETLFGGEGRGSDGSSSGKQVGDQSFSYLEGLV